LIKGKGGLTFSGSWSWALIDAVELNNCIDAIETGSEVR
jgi:hypothetical protein